MNASMMTPLKQIVTLRWKPNKDLLAVAVSWILVVGALYSATNIVGQSTWGGVAHFLLYALLGATLLGVGIPLYWTSVVRRRPVADLGISTRWLALRLGLQLVFAVFLYMGTLAKSQIPSLEA